MSPEIQAAMLELLPIIAGGALTALGGGLGALLAHRLDLSREVQIRRQERLEALATAAYEVGEWHEERVSAMLFRQQDFEKRCPTDKLRLLVNLHFPHLRKEMIAVLEASMRCQAWTNDTWAEQRNSMKVSMGKADKMEAYYPLAKNLIARIDTFIEAIRRGIAHA